MTTKSYTKQEDKDTLYNIKSTTDGLTVIKSQENDEELFTINADVAFQKHYTKGEVDRAITENNKRAQSLTKYNGRFTQPTKMKYNNGDRPPVLSYNPVTSFGVMKLDATFYSTINHSEVVAEFPAGTPQPIEFIEVQTYIGGEPLSMWYQGRTIRITTVPQSLVGKRVILNFVGLFS